MEWPVTGSKFSWNTLMLMKLLLQQHLLDPKGKTKRLITQATTITCVA